MGRSPCCSKEGLNRGAWTAQEDKILRDYITVHGQGKWRNLPQRAGLKRCGKSCRLRWLNYLRPDIKRGNISPDEEELIIRLHKLLGNRWSLIAGRLPGRTDNEIKNYWNTNLGKKVRDLHTSTSSSQPNEKNNLQKSKPQSTPEVSPSSLPLSLSPSKAKLDAHNSLLVVTKASKCSKSLFVDLDPLPHSPMPLQNKPNADELEADYAVPTLVDDDAANKQINSNCNETETNVHDDNGNSSFPKSDGDEEFSTDLLLDFDIGEICLPDLLISDFPDICDFGYNNNNNNSSSSEQMLPFSDQVLVASDEILKDSTRSNVCDEKNVADNSFSEE